MNASGTVARMLRAQLEAPAAEPPAAEAAPAGAVQPVAKRAVTRVTRVSLVRVSTHVLPEEQWQVREAAARLGLSVDAFVGEALRAQLRAMGLQSVTSDLST